MTLMTFGPLIGVVTSFIVARVAISWGVTWLAVVALVAQPLSTGWAALRLSRIYRAQR
jgi:hypothetical protein